MSDIALKWGLDGADLATAPTGVEKRYELRLPRGLNSDYASTPSSSALNGLAAGTLDLRAHLSVRDWLDSEAAIIDRSDNGSSGSWQFSFFFATPGLLCLSLSEDGSFGTALISTASVSFGPGRRGWVRAFTDFDLVWFYTSDDGVNWAQLGDAVSFGASLYNGGGDLRLGMGHGYQDPLVGTMILAEIRSAGAVVVQFDPTNHAGAGSFVSATGETWTMNGAAAIAVVGDLPAFDLAVDDGLETAVLLSIYLDRHAEPGDVLPDGATDRKGWWGDAEPVVDGDKIGSRLWQLAREKQTADTANRAQEYVAEALQWMVEDKVAEKIEVATEFVKPGFLGIAATLHRPNTDPVTFRFNYAWASQEAKQG